MNCRKLLPTLLLFISCSQLFSQKSDFDGNDTTASRLDSIVTIPLRNIMYRDYGIPFLIWKQQPKSASFILCDRWGEVLHKSDQPDFVLDADDIKRRRIREDETYFYIIKIVTATGEAITIRGTLKYLGYWRCG